MSASGGYPLRRRFWFSCSMVMVLVWLDFRDGLAECIRDAGNAEDFLFRALNGLSGRLGVAEDCHVYLHGCLP